MKDEEALCILGVIERVCRKEHMDTEADAIAYGMLAINKDAIEVGKWYSGDIFSVEQTYHDGCKWWRLLRGNANG